MTSVKPHIPSDDLPVVGMLGVLMDRVRAGLPSEEWGGLRMSHLRVLSFVPADGVNVTELAARARMTKQGCGQFVSTLVTSGHLSVTADPADARVRMVRRTRLGDDTARAVTARMDEIEQAWAAEVGARRYAGFRRVLAELSATADDEDVRAER